MKSVQDLVRKYDQPGPRYTSYPTAVEFTPKVTPADYARHLDLASTIPGSPLSLYTHLPFCEKRCLFCGCHVVASPLRDRVAPPYLEHLKREIALAAGRLGERTVVAQYHWGGGTPTYLTTGQMEELFGAFAAHFTLVPNAEVAVEVDPRVTTTPQLETLNRLGFNRISVGIQDFDPQVQQTIGRIQPRDMTEDLILAARNLGIGGVNVDLIYGLPGQTPAAFGKTAEQIVEIAPDRIAIYSFAYVPWLKAHQRKLPQDEIPGGYDKFLLFREAERILLAAGYQYIGMDHFAKPDDELAVAYRQHRLYRNFMGYTTHRASDMIGFGVSSIGNVAGAFFQNEKKLTRYYGGLAEGRFPVERGYVLTESDNLRAEIIQSLMCYFHVDLDEVLSRHPDFDGNLDESVRRLEPLEADGLVEVNEGRISVTPTGRYFVRNIALCFDEYSRGKRDATKPTFSRTV